MKPHVEETIEILKSVKDFYKNPIIYTGFGKDSIVVLHLANRVLGYDWPIMFHRDWYFPQKYQYAQKMLELWNLTAIDYMAHASSVFYRNNTIEVVKHYHAGPYDMVFCAMLYEPKDYNDTKSYLCGYRDLYLQPKGDIHNFMWDVCLQGHRQYESKPHSGHKPNGLRWTCKQAPGGPDFVQPLRNWRNQDVYEYIKENDIPINWNVYYVGNKGDGDELLPLEDKTFNPDCRPACTKCMRPEEGLSVLCPKRKMHVNSVVMYLKQTEMPVDYKNYLSNEEEERLQRCCK